ncbi:putative peroxidasin-like isoform X2 [Apostichopus japonicus]|uniref:Putative peroxidasin-like isoform X2 n=1 Tax=Stichopus japonicus TaxID=307972 RepID=A0A2G8JZY1_STIJA|nr:putative peroxidasin-like isoform X2 [Apostichopus japonicus]
MSNVKWYRETAPQDPVATIEGETIQITDNNLYALTEYGSLTIKHLRHEQEGSYYVEYVTPDGLKQTRTVYIYIRASFLTCRDTVSYEEGRKAIISCNLVGRNVIWYRGSHSSPIAKIEDGTMSVANCNIYGIIEDGSLIINHLRREQEGVYIIEHVSSDGEMVTKALTVKIEENIFTASNLNCPKTVTAKEGSEAIIRCGLIKMSNVKWYRDTAPQDPVATIERETTQITDNNLYALTEDVSLTIKHLRHEQEGSYFIEYVTPDGVKQTRMVDIYIRERYSVTASLAGILVIILVVGYLPAWPSQPGKTSLMEAYKQNICPIPLPWEEYFLATDGKKKIIRHDQLNSNTNLYAEMQVLITWPNGKTEEMSSLSFFKSDKSKTLRRVLFVGDIGCSKTSFVKQVSYLWSQMITDEIYLFYLNLQNTNLNGNMAEEISKQLPEDCKIENIEFIIKNERCLLIFDGSNEFSDLNLKLGRKESGEQSYLTFQNFVRLAEVNNNVRIWLTSRPCFPPQFSESFAVVNFLSFKEDELKSYIKHMCVYYKTLKEQAQFPIQNFQELSSETELEPHGNDEVNVISRSVWSILERNDLLKLDADALLMGIVIQLLVSSEYGIMNKHTVGIDLTSFPSIIKLLVKCLHQRHAMVTKHLITTSAFDNLVLMIGRLFLNDDTLSIEQLEEEKREITLLCGILKICPNSGNGTLDKDSTNTSYGFRCRHQFIQELCVAKYVSTDKQKLKDFREASNKYDEGRKNRILMLTNNDYST